MTSRLGLRLGLGALVLAVQLTALAGLAGCQAKESEPVAVARAFANSARRGDVEAMLAVVEHSAVEHLREAAETASDQVGGRRSIEPQEMLQIVGVDRTVAVATAELIDEDGRTAHVELTMTDGRKLRLELVWEADAGGAEPIGEAAGPGEDGGGSWKVRIPVPRATGAVAPKAPDA